MYFRYARYDIIIRLCLQSEVSINLKCTSNKIWDLISKASNWWKLIKFLNVILFEKAQSNDIYKYIAKFLFVVVIFVVKNNKMMER